MNTIAAPYWSAIATASSSRTEPPGWMNAVTPAWQATSTPSGKGKKASEARTAPLARSPARSTAMRTESTR